MRKNYIIIGIILVPIFIVLAYNFLKLAIDNMVIPTGKSPFIAFIILLGLYCLKSVIMIIPLILLYIAAGIIFQTEIAILISYCCLAVESTIGFLLGKKLGHKRIERIISKNKHLSLMFKFSRSNNLLTVIVLRLIPGPPFDLCSMFIGASGIDYLSFIAGTLIAVTPGMIPVILMGTAITNPLSLNFIIPLLIKIAVVLSIILYFKKSLARIPH
ncbi:MAG: TVP38/TMEM64 family protein [Clostridiales bacterium]|nr:TVP38/TMEM64 family protein [Clostridiales bacterium]